MGRPSKYKPELCDALKREMAEGLSFEASCGAIGISKDTGYEWSKRYPDFARAKIEGETLGQLFWERAAVAACTPYKGINPLELSLLEGDDREAALEADRKAYHAAQNFKFNATAWVFTMKNRFSWRDKKELMGVGGGALFHDLTVGQLDQKIEEIVGRLPPELLALLKARK